MRETDTRVQHAMCGGVCGHTGRCVEEVAEPQGGWVVAAVTDPHRNQNSLSGEFGSAAALSTFADAALPSRSLGQHGRQEGQRDAQ